MKTVIEMAREAGIITNSPYLMPHDHVLKGIERFAELVRAEEREAIIDIVMHAPFTASMSKEDFNGEKGVSVKAMAFQICSEIRERSQS